MVGSLILGAAAGVQQAKAQTAAAEATEQQSKENAKAANAQAQNTVLAAQVEEDRRRQQTRAMLGKQRAALAANNVDMSIGTPMELLGDTAAIGEQDALTIRANAARQAWGYKVDANNSLNEGRVAMAAGKNAATGTYLTTAASLMSQGSSLAGGMKKPPKLTTTSSGGGTRNIGPYL